MKTTHAVYWKRKGVPRKSTKNKIYILMHLQVDQWQVL